MWIKQPRGSNIRNVGGAQWYAIEEITEEDNDKRGALLGRLEADKMLGAIQQEGASREASPSHRPSSRQR